MGAIEALALAMGTAWTSGINLYATVAALGIANLAQMIQLPPDLQVLSHPAVIGIACTMYMIEFFADKVPYVDSGWDVLHTFIRVPAGAILAARTLGDMDPALELAALLAGGSIALTAHGAPPRLVRQASPAPPEAALTSAWRAGWLPAGFKLIGTPAHPNGQTHLLYSDGLAYVSVYIEPLRENARPMAGTERRGAVNLYAQPAHDQQVVVIGDVPAATVEHIARAVEPVPAPH